MAHACIGNYQIVLSLFFLYYFFKIFLLLLFFCGFKIQFAYHCQHFVTEL